MVVVMVMMRMTMMMMVVPKVGQWLGSSKDDDDN